MSCCEFSRVSRKKSEQDRVEPRPERLWMRGSRLFRIGPVDAHNAGIAGIGLRRQRQGYQTPSPHPPKMKMTG